MNAEKRKYEFASELGLKISADAVQKALARLVADGEIDDAARAEIWWFYNYAQERNWSLADAGKAIRKDSTTAWRLFMGRYGAKYDNLLNELRVFRKLAEERDARRRVGFIETSTWKKIEQVCRHAQVTQKRVFVYGASQIGKTTCLEEYARRNNHGQTKMLRMPSAPTVTGFLYQVAKACYIPTGANQNIVRERIFGAIDDRMLLIVDEVHQALIGCSTATAIRIMEFIREIHDRCKCGYVLSGTKVLKDEIEGGRIAGILEQTRRRGIVDLVLPDVPPKADVAKLSAAFGLQPPEGIAAEIVSEILRKSGLGQVIAFLQSAANLAGKQQKPLSWDHFVIAYDVINKL